MDTPEGFVPQEQHDAAMLALREELNSAINSKQDEINLLKSQIVEANEANSRAMAEISDIINGLRDEVAEHKAASERYQSDNLALRKNLSDYLLSTDGGKSALIAFNVLMLKAQIEAAQKKLIELGVS
jgi:hypothetical protein